MKFFFLLVLFSLTGFIFLSGINEKSAPGQMKMKQARQPDTNPTARLMPVAGITDKDLPAPGGIAPFPTTGNTILKHTIKAGGN